MEEHLNDLAAYLHSRFEGIEVIEGDFEVSLGHVCDQFGGCAQCKGLMVAREMNAQGEQVGPTRLFLCSHWCHNNNMSKQ
ncbi:MAG TPA: hypothetical protein VGU25_14845 [Acidobacteriaceae bacterium]|nr:hypothetical protein [Acidobacteriaceae bacterium]